MLIIDWHLDLAWNALEWDRDLTRPVAEIRRREGGSRPDLSGPRDGDREPGGVTRGQGRSRRGNAPGQARSRHVR